MKRFIIALFIMFTAALPAAACEISANGLSKESVAQLKVACEQAKLDTIKLQDGSITPSAVASFTPERISAIGAVAQEIAKALGSAAKELGVAVNDFLLSPAGILVVLGIFWKLFLTQTIGLFGVVFTIIVSMWFVKRTMVLEYTVVEKRWLWGAWTTTVNRPTYTPFRDLSDNQGWSLFWIIVFTLILEAICIFGLLS